jgi:hypothetical protein
MHKLINQFFERYTVGKRSQMESARTVEGRGNGNHEKIVRFVRLLEKIGPDIKRYQEEWVNTKRQ